MTILEALVQLRDDIKLWVINNLNARVPKTRTINGKELSEDIVISADDITDIVAVTNEQIDTLFT